MRAFLITDNEDTLIGLKAAGINGILLQNKDEVLKKLNEINNDKEIGIIILTEKIGAFVQEEIKKIKLSRSIPLIIEIPDNYGKIKEEDYILKYVKESIGIKI